MEILTYLGFAAGSLCTISFLPQLIKIIKTKHTKDLSLAFFLLYLMGIILWFFYGMLRKDIAIISANAVAIILAAIILFFKLKYK